MWRLKPRLAFAVAAVISALLIATPAWPGDPDSAEAFLRLAYSKYPLPSRKLADADSQIWPDWAHPEAYYTQPLGQMLIEVIAAQSNGDLLFDFDPICSCQDDDGFRDLKIVMRNMTENTADASAAFLLSQGYPHVQAGFRLVRTAAGWRIADVSNEFIPRLSDYFKEILDDICEQKGNRAKIFHKKE
jgi:hypothetical protein